MHQNKCKEETKKYEGDSQGDAQKWTWFCKNIEEKPWPPSETFRAQNRRFVSSDLRLPS